MAQPDADVSPATLMVEVWGRDNPRALRLTTTRLRAKLESDPDQPRYVQDAPGGGVRFHDHGAGSPPDSPIAPGSPVDFEVVAELRDLLDDRDAAAFRELRERFSRTTQEATGLMRAATTAADASTLGVEAHRLRGSSAVIGALRINALAALLEQRARAADLATVPSILDQLPAELRLFEQALVPLLA
jgi:HPt (histidine-containing phosphotransfer) domain-containing protein